MGSKEAIAEAICQVALKAINKQTADDDDSEMVEVAPTTFQVLCTYQGRDHFFRQEVWSGREEVKTRHVIPLFSTCTIVYSVFTTFTTKKVWLKDILSLMCQKNGKGFY